MMRMATALALALVVGVSAPVGVSSEAYAVNSNKPGAHPTALEKSTTSMSCSDGINTYRQ
jgi:hypothetical protein